MVGMATLPDYDDPSAEIALFRYGLIAALIQRLPDKGSLEGQLRQIAAGRYTIPYSTRTSMGVSTL